MSNITTVSANPLTADVPDFLRDAGVSELTKTLAGGDRVKRIVPKNGIFSLVVGKDAIGKVKNDLPAIIVNASPKVGRIFYARAWTPDAEPTAPDCFSNDGNVPDAKAASPQARTCNECPQNIKGSGQGGTKACRFTRRLAVMLEQDFGTPLEGEVYQMNLAAMSLFGEGPADRYTFEEYVKYLKNNGRSVDHMVTNITFNEDRDNQGLLFSPVRYVSKHEYALGQKAAAMPEVQKIIVFTPYQADMAGRGAAPALAAPVPAAAATFSAEKSPAAAVAADADVPAPTVRAAKAEQAPPAGKPSLSSVLAEWGSTPAA